MGRLMASRVAGWRKLAAGDPAYSLGIRWIITAPDGSQGSIREGTHTVTEHDDGTITVEPSLVMPSGWHGWLRQGRFTSV